MDSYSPHDHSVLTVWLSIDDVRDLIACKKEKVDEFAQILIDYATQHKEETIPN